MQRRQRTSGKGGGCKESDGYLRFEAKATATVQIVWYSRVGYYKIQAVQLDMGMGYLHRGAFRYVCICWCDRCRCADNNGQLESCVLFCDTIWNDCVCRILYVAVLNVVIARTMALSKYSLAIFNSRYLLDARHTLNILIHIHNNNNNKNKFQQQFSIQYWVK